MTLVKRTSTLSRTKEVGMGRDIKFETCVQAVIAEDSMENSAINESFRTSVLVNEIAALNKVGQPKVAFDQFMQYQEEVKQNDQVHKKAN